MYLGENEAQRFYKIWLGLLTFTNHKHKVVPKLKEIKNATTLNPQELVPIKNKLWEDENLIDEYLKQYGNSLSVSEVEIANSWKRKVAGKFIILKCLKKYTVFMHGEEGGRLYGVIGISNPLEEMFPSARLPVYVEAVIIPYEGKIIYDSILMPYSIRFGSGMKAGLKDDYRRIKEKYGIITVL